MDVIEIEGGEVLANLEDRTLTGLLIPYGEVGRTNVGQFQVEAGIIQLPEDPAVMSLNLDHDRYTPVGRAVKVWEEPAGILATFAIANTPAGDAALADARDPNGKRRRLSAEFTTGIKAGKATGGVLAAAALVEQGAFASAMVLAADTAEHNESSYTDENGVTWLRQSDITTETTETENGTETVTTITTVEETTTDATPAAEDTTTEETEEDPMNEVQATTVRLPKSPAGQTTPRTPGGQEILAALASYRTNPLDAAAHQVLAALSDIKLTGSGALPASGVLQPNWLGLLDLGTPYVREYVTLLKLGTAITAGGKKAFKFGRNTAASPQWANDGTWTGNKSEINSGTGYTATVESSLLRYARGADIGREFFDLPGGKEVIEAFLRELEIDHAQWSDEKARALIVATAGAPVAPKVYPGVDGHDYAGAMGQLIQGILAVKRRKADGRRDVPTFAIANELAYEELIYTPKDLVPEFVSFTANTDGTGTADGKVHIVQGDTGVAETSSVVVGADYGIEVDELPGGPLHVNALEIAKGGVDEAVHGYMQTFVARPEAFVHIGVADETP